MVLQHFLVHRVIPNISLERQYQPIRGEQNLFFVWIFFSALHDTKSVIGVAIATDPGGKKYIFGIEMFGGALCGIIFVIGVVIATDPGGTEYFFRYCNIC